MCELVMKYPMTNDLLFKAVFGREEELSKFLLMELLNALLNLKGRERIQQLTHKNPFSLVGNYTEKETIFDIKVILESGELVDIEMQVEATFAYRKRSLFYWSKLHSEQPLRGKNYNEVCRSICINIVNSSCILESDKLHNVFRVIESEEHFVLCNDLEIHYFQLPNLSGIITSYRFDEDGFVEIAEHLNDEELWLLFIREVGRGNEKMIRTLLEKKEVLKMTYDVYDKLNNDELMKEKLEAHQKYLWDRSAREEDARKEGVEQGIEQGSQETKIMIAKNLLLSGFTDEQIISTCCISLEQLNEVKSEVSK